MKFTRRQLIQYGAAGGLAATAPWGWASNHSRPLNILILGGTAFLGPALVEDAIARGHTVTLFNRGKTNSDLFPELESLRGDRDDQLEALKGRQWDAVIDTSGYVPRHVRLSAELLAPHVKHYLFVSTISVYSDFSQPGLDEQTGPLGALDDLTVEQVTGETYGPLKALCEQAAEAAMPGRVCTVRPGLIVGPRDRSDRFTYWPVRVDRGGQVLCPGSPEDGIQVIDVRDLAHWCITCLEDKITGIYNATSTPGLFSMGQVLQASQAASTSQAELTWVPSAFLEKHEVQPWSEMPAWFPAEGEMAGFAEVSVAAATGKGLTFRPMAETVKDTLAWFSTLPEERRAKLRAGIAPEKEKQVLQAWSEENA